jgi:hypothetical protein
MARTFTPGLNQLDFSGTQSINLAYATNVEFQKDLWRRVQGAVEIRSTWDCRDTGANPGLTDMQRAA